MQAIKDIYRIGYGPSSSHTIGPMRIADLFLKEYGLLDKYIVTLKGSLSLTGKGHRTDDIINISLKGRCEFIFEKDYEDTRNRLVIEGFKDGKSVALWHAESLGGGAIHIDEFETHDNDVIYNENKFEEIKEYLSSNNMDLLTYIYNHESDLKEYLDKIIDIMCESVERGLESDGLINDKLKVYRTAKGLLKDANEKNDDDLRKMAYAYAAAEENAMGHMVATAPTLGSCGIVASLVYFYLNNRHFSKDKLIDALAIGGMFGNIIKQNASIAGAVGGCQAEVGTACSMAAAMVAYLEGFDLKTIEYAAEIGIEHHLGLTCDPVMGYVIIPCIERNAVAILRSFDAAKLASSTLRFREHLVTFDMVVSSMNYTGKKLSPELKETSLGGLALEFK